MYSSIINDRKRWKQPKCSSPMNHEQNVLYPYSGILLSHKRSELLLCATTWMDFENIILSERSQIQKTTYCLITWT